MVYQYSPLTFLIGLSVIASLVLIAGAWRARHSREGMAFIGLMIASLLWTGSALIEFMYTDLASKIFWSKTAYLGIGSVFVVWPVFVLLYVRRENWLTRRTIALLVIEPLVILAFVWTNEAHGLIWSSTSLAYNGSLVILHVTHGPVFWIHAVYGYLLLFSTEFLLARKVMTSTTLYRGQMVMLLGSIIVPWLGNILYLLGISPVDLTPIGFTITGMALGWGLLRFRLLDIIPVARETVVDSMSDGVLVLDEQLRVVDMNMAARKIIPSGTTTVIGLPVVQAAPFIHERLKQQDEQADAEVELPVGEGAGRRYFDMHITPLHDHSNHLTGRVVTLHDITERKETAQRIQKQNEALAQTNRELDEARKQAEEATHLKSQFLATMSHELRTPLNAIIGYTEIQLAGMTGELTEEQRNYQNRILKNSEHLLKLINEVLDLAKIEAQRTDIVRKPFQVQEWFNDVILQTEGLARQKGLRFEHTLDERLPKSLVGDAARLKQVAINLLSNAVKFTDAGFVRLEIRKYSMETWTLLVTDSGIGIPSHMQEVVFEEFRQVDSSSRRSYGGTGLGLAIVRKLALLMGGSVRLDSHVGEGSTFTVFLPLTEAEIISAPAEADIMV